MIFLSIRNFVLAMAVIAVMATIVHIMIVTMTNVVGDSVYTQRMFRRTANSNNVSANVSANVLGMHVTLGAVANTASANTISVAA